MSGNEAAVPSSSTLLPPPAVTPSHIQLGKIPMPPIDVPPNVTDADVKDTRNKREVPSNAVAENSGEVGKKLISSTHAVASPLCRCLETHQPCPHNHPKVSSVHTTPGAGIVTFTNIYLLNVFYD